MPEARIGNETDFALQSQRHSSLSHILFELQSEKFLIGSLQKNLKSV